MTTTDKATNLNLDAMIYLEAPDSYKETESGKLILNSMELRLPGDISFSLGKLKTAKYENKEDKHIIKVTTNSRNEIYFSISGASKLKTISCAETISNAIQNFDPTAPQPVEPQAPTIAPTELEQFNEKTAAFELTEIEQFNEKATDSKSKDSNIKAKTIDSESKDSNIKAKAIDSESKDNNIKATDSESKDNNIKAKATDSECKEKPESKDSDNNTSKSEALEPINKQSNQAEKERKETSYKPPIFLVLANEVYKDNGQINIARFISNSDSKTDQVDIAHVIINLENKTIKYIHITIEAYDRVDELIGKRTLKITGPISHQELQFDEYSKFFVGNEYLPTKCIKAANIIITYMDNTSIEITDKKMIDAIMSKEALQREVDPPSEPLIYMAIKWGIDGVSADNCVDVDVYYLLQNKKINSVKITLQAYNKSGNPLGKARTLESSNFKQVEYSNLKMCKLNYSGNEYSSIVDIKITSCIIQFKDIHIRYSGELTNYVVQEYVAITDENLLKAMTSNIAIKSVNDELNQSLEKKLKKEQERLERERKEEQERKEMKEFQNPKLSGWDVILILILIMIIVFIISWSTFWGICTGIIISISLPYIIHKLHNNKKTK